MRKEIGNPHRGPSAPTTRPRDKMDSFTKMKAEHASMLEALDKIDTLLEQDEHRTSEDNVYEASEIAASAVAKIKGEG